MRVLSKNVERDVPSHLTWLSDSMIQPHTSLQCFQVSLLCPLSSTISSPLPGPINMSHPGLSGSNFGASPNVISWWENGICVLEKHSAAGSVQESFFFLFCLRHMFEAIVSPSRCLRLFGINPSALGHWKSSLTAVCSCLPSWAVIVSRLKH